MQENYVKFTYNIIAKHFNDTRAYVWKGVKEYVKNFEKGSYILECGCGMVKIYLLEMIALKVLIYLRKWLIFVLKKV